MLGLNLPEVKWKESVESTTKNCTFCAETGRQIPQTPTPKQIPLCLPDISLPPLSKRVIYSESNYRGDHKFFLPPPLQSNSSIHIKFQGRIMEHTQRFQYSIFLNFLTITSVKMVFLPSQCMKKNLMTPITKMPCVLIKNYCIKSRHPILV